ncbi:hypothetical protein SRO_2252 [Streptomyces rochei]|nr:hypothetical protein SRO_2252 [Streptomyces rochei]
MWGGDDWEDWDDCEVWESIVTAPKGEDAARGRAVPQRRAVTAKDGRNASS